MMDAKEIMRKVIRIIINKTVRTLLKGLKVIKKRPGESLIALIFIALLVPPITMQLVETFGILTGFGFVMSIIASFTSGKLVTKPERILFILIGCLLCVSAVNIGAKQFLDSSGDFSAMFVGLFIAAVIWLQGGEIKGA